MQEHPLNVAFAWLVQASADLDTARYLQDGGRFDAACFSSQQAAEKAFKGLLIWLAGDKPRTHIIRELLHQISEHHEVPENVRDVRMLDTFYVSSRYPDALGGASPTSVFVADQARLAVDAAAVAVDYALRILPTPE